MKVKKLILVTSPPACGKTFISKNLAKALDNCVYLDKDDLIVLSKKILKLLDSLLTVPRDFFHEWIRDAEYEAIMVVALDALNYNDTVLINAPFKREIRDDAWVADLRKKLAAKGAELCLIWVNTDVEVVHRRMIQRNSREIHGSLSTGMSMLQLRTTQLLQIFRICLFSTTILKKSSSSQLVRQ